MTESDHRKQCLRDEVLAMTSFDGLAPEDLRQALESFQVAAGADLPSTDLETLIRQPPAAPRSFFEKWADRFAAWAVENFLPEKLELMCDGSSKGRMLTLVEYFEFAEENATDLHRDLVALARTDGVSPEAALFLLQAVSVWREGRLDRRKA